MADPEAAEVVGVTGSSFFFGRPLPSGFDITNGRTRKAQEEVEINLQVFIMKENLYFRFKNYRQL